MADSTSRQRLLDLELERINAGLDAAERQELEALRREHSDVDAAELERAAVAVELTFLEREEMPEGLAERIAERGRAFLAPAGGSPGSAPDPRFAAPPRRGPSTVWWAAMAACLVAAIIGWLRPVDDADPGPSAPAVTAEKVRQQFLSEPATRLIELQATGDESAIEAGDVAWHQGRQHGFIRLVGLPVNDPSQMQYQLWIIDGGREQYPVDGGVFDIDRDGEVVVPIDPKLEVRDPKAFAITIEPPGGVVVSTQERVVAIGEVS